MASMRSQLDKLCANLMTGERWPTEETRGERKRRNEGRRRRRRKKRRKEGGKCQTECTGKMPVVRAFISGLSLPSPSITLLLHPRCPFQCLFCRFIVVDGSTSSSSSSSSSSHPPLSLSLSLSLSLFFFFFSLSFLFPEFEAQLESLRGAGSNA